MTTKRQRVAANLLMSMITPLMGAGCSVATSADGEAFDTSAESLSKGVEKTGAGIPRVPIGPINTGPTEAPPWSAPAYFSLGARTGDSVSLTWFEVGSPLNAQTLVYRHKYDVYRNALGPPTLIKTFNGLPQGPAGFVDDTNNTDDQSGPDPDGVTCYQLMEKSSGDCSDTHAGYSCFRTPEICVGAYQVPSAIQITANDQAGLLVQALGQPGTTITVANDVELDLSSFSDIAIQAGVTLVGGRTPRDAGPLVYTTTRPSILFHVVGDNVRITGMRIRGSDMGVVDDGTSDAILDDSWINLEIDNNELSGFCGSAVDLQDKGQRIAENNSPTGDALNPEALRVHDNYIHHNQHQGAFGYGVAVGAGAYAMIERNVFDWNRHAISGDGSDGSGYRAERNLVLKNGGLHKWMYGFWTHIQQFDMHGQDSCGVGDLFSDTVFNCGTAGDDTTIRFNTFLYTEAAAIKLRGTPQMTPFGMFVGSNVFAHNDISDAVQQEESGLEIEGGNLTGVDASGELGSCDFDADGVNDTFMATGQTWWYSSGGTMPWSYLNTSTRRLSEVSLGYFDADPSCDVFADDTIFSGGKPAIPVPHRVRATEFETAR